MFRYRLGTERDSKGRPKLKEMGLGPYHTVSLQEAREAALAARKDLLAFRQGKEGTAHPIAARRAARQAAQTASAKAITFKQCAEAYIAAHQAGWRNSKHAAQWTSTLGAYVYPVLGDLLVKVIDVGLVMNSLRPIWTKKPETANRVRGRIERVLDWATASGYREGENPARWRGHLDNLLPHRSKVQRVEHHAALPYSEMTAFLAELREQEGIAARALEFTILTASRTGEVVGARWSEINVAERLWTIPAERMKAGREHRVPLSGPVMAIIEKMAAIRSGEYVFPGLKTGQSLSNMAGLMLLRRMGRSDLTVHGFQSTFRDWAAERTSFPAEVAETALAHTVGDKVEAAYRRGDLFQKRRALAEAWGRFCEASPVGEIVALHTRPAVAPH